MRDFMKKFFLCFLVIGSTTFIAQATKQKRPAKEEVKVKKDKKKIPSRLQERMQDEMQGVRLDDSSQVKEN